jgi:hypothetical protein
MPRGRLRKWAKWACTVAAVLAVGVAAFSRFYRFYWESVSRGRARDLRIVEVQGLLTVSYSPGPELSGNGWADQVIVERFSGWDWGLAGGDTSFRTGWLWHAGFVWSNEPGGWDVGISVIYPVALTLIPAALLWYADRRRPGPRACGGCGYDRRGLAVGAKCPECGTVPNK